MTKLEGVNAVLELCGRQPFPALDTGGASEAGRVERTLDEQDLIVQQEGWLFNTRKDQELTRDGANKIAVPSGCLWIHPSGGDCGRSITQLGGYLYDLEESSQEFTRDLECTYALRYEFGCIPLHIQLYIVARAAWEYNEKHVKDKAVRRHLEGRLAMAKGDAERIEIKVADTNILNTSEHRRLRGRTVHYSQRFYGR